MVFQNYKMLLILRICRMLYYEDQLYLKQGVESTALAWKYLLCACICSIINPLIRVCSLSRSHKKLCTDGHAWTLATPSLSTPCSVRPCSCIRSSASSHVPFHKVPLTIVVKKYKCLPQSTDPGYSFTVAKPA